MNSAFYRRARRIIVCGAALLATVLAACGGGSDDPGPPRLVATQAKASAYVGVWRSGCGTLVSSTNIETVKHVFDITTANGRVATGTLATMHYRTASACPDALPTHTTSLNVTLTIDPAATNITGVYTGAADKVVVSALGSMPSTIYVGFLDSMNGFYISNSTHFDDKRLLYSR